MFSPMEKLINSIKSYKWFLNISSKSSTITIDLKDYIYSYEHVAKIDSGFMPRNDDLDDRIKERKSVMRDMINNIVSSMYFKLNNSFKESHKLTELADNNTKHYVVAYKNINTKFGPTRILCLADSMPLTFRTDYKVYWSNKIINEFIDKRHKKVEDSKWNYDDGKFILLPTGTIFYFIKQRIYKFGVCHDVAIIDFNNYLERTIYKESSVKKENKNIDELEEYEALMPKDDDYDEY
jgi:hypothetical protein